MATKGGKAKGAKGKKGKAGQLEVKSKLDEGPITAERQLTEVERTFYDLTTEDIKRKIKRLRAHILNLNVVNETLEKEIQLLKEDKKDEAGELSKKVDDIYKNILKLRNENEKLTATYTDEKRRAEETIGDLQKKHKAMHDQLNSEIKQLNGKLNACEEFHFNRDNWQIKFSERAAELADKELEAKKELRKMEAKSSYERELLKDKLLEKMTLAGEEYTGAGSASTSATDLNMRLIRENIALQKNIDMLINSNDEMDARMQKELQLYEANKASVPVLEARNRVLIGESQEKLDLINRLTNEVQKLKQDYIDGLTYRQQNVTIKEFQICARFRRRKLQKQVSQVGQRLHNMEREMSLYDYLTEQYNNERKRVDARLENLRLTVERAIGMTNVPEVKLSFHTKSENSLVLGRDHGDLLNKLAWLLQTDFDTLDVTRRASMETIKPYENLTRFDDLFRKEAPSLSSLMDLCVAYVESDTEAVEGSYSSIYTIAMHSSELYDTKEYTTKLPPMRPLGKNYIFDVETGTSLYYSSEPDDPTLLEKKADDALTDEEGLSSSSESPKRASGDSSPPPVVAKKQTTATPASTAAPSAVAASEVSEVSKLPPGTIVDVVIDEDDEVNELVQSDFETEEPYVEDEEFDINLFY